MQDDEADLKTYTALEQDVQATGKDMLRDNLDKTDLFIQEALLIEDLLSVLMVSWFFEAACSLVCLL